MRSLIVLAGCVLLTLTGCTCFDLDPFCDDDCSASCADGSPYCEPQVPEAPLVDLPNPVLSVHSEEVTKIVQEVSVNFRYDHHLHLEDAHTYYNNEGIHTIQLKYISQDILDVCEARKLIIDLVEAMSSRLNENPYLLPEFANFAFYPFNFEIYITFESFFIRYVDPFYIKYICMEDGHINYYAADLDDNNKSCWHVRRESYYTSRDIVFYQRKAEEAYRQAHSLDMSVFGNKRFIPKDEEQ